MLHIVLHISYKAVKKSIFMMAPDRHLGCVFNGELKCKNNTRNEFYIPANLSKHIVYHSMTINSKVDFHYVHDSHLEFMQIVGVAQSCGSSNHVWFFLEHIFITNQQQKKTSLYSTFLGSGTFKWTRSITHVFKCIYTRHGNLFYLHAVIMI